MLFFVSAYFLNGYVKLLGDFDTLLIGVESQCLSLQSTVKFKIRIREKSRWRGTIQNEYIYDGRRA